MYLAVQTLKDKMKKIAAHLLEASDTDIEFSNGEFKVAGTDRKKAFAEIALTAYVPHNYPLDKLEPGLNENAFYDPTNFTYPAGSYVCEVEVDPATVNLPSLNSMSASAASRRCAAIFLPLATILSSALMIAVPPTASEREP